MPFFGEFGRSSQDLGESDYDSPKSWDDWLNSPKSGMCIIGDWNTRNFLFATQGMSCFEHTECLALDTRNVLLRTQGMSFSNTRNVLLRTQTMSSFEHKECPSSNIRNVLLRTKRMSFFVETTQKCDQCDHSNHTSYLQHCERANKRKNERTNKPKKKRTNEQTPDFNEFDSNSKSNWTELRACPPACAP